MFGKKRGTWWVKCKSNPLWDGEGSAMEVGRFQMPEECQYHLAVITKRYGPPPADCQWGYIKD